MKISELYSKKIERPFEAVVDINKFDAKVVQTEIDEYVFTEEIISGLYQILKGIQYHNKKVYIFYSIFRHHRIHIHRVYNYI